MQISDLVNQYMNIGGTAEGFSGTKGVRNIATTLREMSAGNVFEGTVQSSKNGKVVLALSNGQTVTARMDEKMSLKTGESMFFQVKSNDGSQIAIRPFTMQGNQVNLTLMQALRAANLPTEERNLTMVNAMMKEQMPIDVNSLNRMARIANLNPQVNVETIVQMQKLGIPIDPQMAAQFENYMDDRQAISVAMESFMEQMPQILTDETLGLVDLQQQNARILTILMDGLEGAMPVEGVLLAEESLPTDVVLLEEGVLPAEGGLAVETEAPETASGVLETASAASETASSVSDSPEAVLQGLNGEDGPEGVAEQVEKLNIKGQTVEAEATVFHPEELLARSEREEMADRHQIGGLMEDSQRMALSEQLLELGIQKDTKLLEDGMLKPQVHGVDILEAVRNALVNNTFLDKDILTNLFGGEGFAKLLKDAMEQQWLLRPQESADGDKIRHLYEKLDKQISRMEEVVKAAGQNVASFADAAADVCSNIEFMNQINRAYTYVQVPLKMNGQNASGELYVYTNKKQLAQEGDRELTAFLHLDLDDLGSTDVSVKLRNKKVDTNFYFDDDASFALVQQFLPLLEERLEKKGYQCSLTVSNTQKKVNFVEDFLKKDAPSSGQLHRYSFDMRA